MKTIAQQINWDFEANGNLEIKDTRGYYIYSENSNGWSKLEYDSQGNQTYWENSYGNWVKREYDSKGKEIYFESSNGFSYKHEYDSEDNKTYYESSTGYWEKKKYDSKGNLIYLENSQDGVVIDRQPESCETKVVEIDGVKYKLTKI